jgi:hypothetical protein
MVTVCPEVLLALPEPELEEQPAASRPAATRRTPAVLRRLIVVALH